jgi:hypothetical protein
VDVELTDEAALGAAAVDPELLDEEALDESAAAAASDAGAEIISTPMLFEPPPPPVCDVGTASTGVDESESAATPLVLASAGGKDAATVKLGPRAPGFRTSVADTTLSGGLKLGTPERAARVTSGFDFSIPIGRFISEARVLWCVFA